MATATPSAVGWRWPGRPSRRSRKPPVTRRSASRPSTATSHLPTSSPSLVGCRAYQRRLHDESSGCSDGCSFGTLLLLYATWCERMMIVLSSKHVGFCSFMRHQAALYGGCYLGLKIRGPARVVGVQVPP